MASRPGFVGVFGAVLFLALFMAVVFAYGELSSCIPAQGPLTIEVKRGESLNNLANRLAREGILRNPRFLRFLAILRGDTGRIKAGEYVLQGNESPNELLDFLVSGKATFIALTIPEGLSLKEIAQRVEEKGLGRAEEFMALAKEPQFAASFGLPILKELPTLEGYVYPETYYFHRGVGAQRVLTQFVEEFRMRAYRFLVENAGRVGLSPYKVLILASIIEKETGLHSERRTISAVFHNRLKARMHLGSDPTVIYGIDEFDGNLTRVHLRTKTRYNTYKIIGLPPTPIANPGLKSLEAAVNPAKVDYLYFVSKGDGSHFFSRDLKTHNRAVWKYQKRRFRRRRS
jgi:UPF0755 protein